MRRALLGVAMMLAANGLARAEDASADAKPAVRREGNHRVYELGRVVIHGKVHRPESMIVLPPARVTYEWPELRRPDPPAPSR